MMANNLENHFGRSPAGFEGDRADSNFDNCISNVQKQLFEDRANFGRDYRQLLTANTLRDSRLQIHNDGLYFDYESVYPRADANATGSPSSSYSSRLDQRIVKQQLEVCGGGNNCGSESEMDYAGHQAFDPADARRQPEMNRAGGNFGFIANPSLEKSGSGTGPANYSEILDPSTVRDQMAVDRNTGNFGFNAGTVTGDASASTAGDKAARITDDKRNGSDGDRNGSDATREGNDENVDAAREMFGELMKVAMNAINKGVLDDKTLDFLKKGFDTIKDVLDNNSGGGCCCGGCCDGCKPKPPDQPTPNPDRPDPKPGPVPDRPDPQPGPDRPDPQPGPDRPDPQPAPDRPDPQPDPEDNPDRPDPQPDQPGDTSAALDRLKAAGATPEMIQKAQEFQRTALERGVSSDNIAKALDNVANLLKGDGNIPHSERAILADQTLEHIANPPLGNDQGPRGYCGLVTQASMMADRNPAQFTSMIQQVADTGSYTAPDGTRVRVPPIQPANEFMRHSDGNMSYSFAVATSAIGSYIGQKTGLGGLITGAHGGRWENGQAFNGLTDRQIMLSMQGLQPDVKDPLLVSSAWNDGSSATTFSSIAELKQHLADGKWHIIVADGYAMMGRGSGPPNHVVRIRMVDGRLQVDNSWGKNSDGMITDAEATDFFLR